MNIDEVAEKVGNILVNNSPHVYAKPKSFRYQKHAKTLGAVAVYQKYEKCDGIIVFFMHNLLTGEKIDLKTFVSGVMPKDFSIQDALDSGLYSINVEFFTGDLEQLIIKIFRVFNNSVTQGGCANDDGELKLVN